MKPSTASRAPTDRDRDAMLEVLTLAFAGDPVWGGWAFPAREHALAQRRAIFGLWLDSALRYPGVRVTPRCEAVALWYPPGAIENTEDVEQQLISTARSALGSDADLFLEICDLFETTHPQAEPHYYLSLLGTHDDHRGRGLGVALLRDGLEQIDRANMPAYLESTNPINLGRYEQLGFAKIGAFELPHDGPRVDMMWREPRGETR
jgi:ribosomal protein S18 acetylase RimI-like enzyme